MTASVWSPGSNNIPQVDPLNAVSGEEFTATTGQTHFTITKFTYTLGGGALTVYVNGSKVPKEEVTETATNQFSIPACEAGDTVEVVANTAALDASAALLLSAANNAAVNAAASASQAADSEASVLVMIEEFQTISSEQVTLSPNIGQYASVIGLADPDSISSVDIYVDGATFNTSTDTFAIRLIDETLGFVTSGYKYSFEDALATANDIQVSVSAGAAHWSVSGTLTSAQQLHTASIRLTRVHSNVWKIDSTCTYQTTEVIVRKLSGVITLSSGLRGVGIGFLARTHTAGTAYIRYGKS